MFRSGYRLDGRHGFTVCDGHWVGEVAWPNHARVSSGVPALCFWTYLVAADGAVSRGLALAKLPVAPVDLARYFTRRCRGTVVFRYGPHSDRGCDGDELHGADLCHRWAALFFGGSYLLAKRLTDEIPAMLVVILLSAFVTIALLPLAVM